VKHRPRNLVGEARHFVRKAPELHHVSRERRQIAPGWGRVGVRPGSRSSKRSASNAPTSNTPFAVANIYYNDAEGIRAMAGAVAWERIAPILPSPAAGLVTVELRDQSGRLLPGLIVGDRWFVIGEEGRRYSIVVRNHSEMRLEAVLSVDGLDVLDGRPASFRKRGYIIAPHERLVVEGFRQSIDAVAAFRFSPVRESYAYEKYRNTRDVGVIGLALFNERGSRFWTSDEVNRRLRANPFPGRFATPP
jgi:hypothetical protein